MHTSIVRNGNHFIRFNSPDSHPRYKDKWLLIDGPWFDYLEKKYKFLKIKEIAFTPYYRMSTVPVETESIMPVYDSPEIIWWKHMEVVHCIFGKKQILDTFEQRLDLTERMSKYPGVHYEPIRNILSKAIPFSAWQCNRGVLPAWIKNEHWDENLEELFSFTTYEVQRL